jgi:glycosyltransferase involved in cell wall biosynthesis
MLNNEFPPLGGGMGTVNQALLNRYASTTELEIDLITSSIGGNEEIEQLTSRIRIIKLPVWNRNIHHSTCRELITYAMRALLRAAKYHRSRAYDFCLAWSTLPAGTVAMLLYNTFSLPYAVWVSGPDIPGFERRYRYLYPLLTPVIRHVWRHAKPVIAKCAGEIEMIKSLDNSIEVKFIPNGVDLNIFRPGPGIPNNEQFRVICVARLIERKGQHHLIQAVKRLSDSGVDVLLSLVGAGDSKREYENLARSLGVHDRIRFVGYIPREEISDFYKTAQVFVLPSYNEGMSLAVLEAMAVGLPVVVTRTGGTAELVEQGINGFVFDWADVDALTNYLRVLANDRKLLHAMGTASLNRAKDFSWDMIADRFLKLFRDNSVDHSLATGSLTKE